jgi:hypothetical protein
VASAQSGRPEGRHYEQAEVRSAGLQASQTLQLTVDEAVRRAVEHNPDLAAVRYGTQVEEAPLSQSESAYVPVFSTVLGTSSNVTPPSNFLLGERGVDTNDLFTSTGLRQRMPWGAGSWRLSWDTSRQSSNSPLTSFDPALQSGFQIAVSQPLLKIARWTGPNSKPSSRSAISRAPD